MVEGFVGLQRPHALVVPVEGGHAALLPQRPEFDGSVRTAGYALKFEKEKLLTGWPSGLGTALGSNPVSTQTVSLRLE